MFVEKAAAPSYEQLRPLKPAVSATFPVYQDLVLALAEAKTHPDDTVAHALAAFAGYAYSSADTVSMIMARMGLAENHCLMVGQYVDAMFISSSCFVVQSRDGRVVLLGYRGTEPVNLISWLTDLDVYPDRVSFPFPDDGGPFEVHAGFYRNVRATRYEIVAALERALQGRSVLDDGRKSDRKLPDGGRMEHPLEALYLTGHSQGGAMAAILAIMLVTEPAYAGIAEKLRACYTYGQPMVGTPALAAACQAHDLLADNVVRYVYRRDVVPHLPPKDSGAFAHFGQEYSYEHAGPWPSWTHQEQPTDQMGNLAGLVEAPLAFVARSLRLFRGLPFHYSLADHGPQHYISALTPPGVPNEFGDSYFVAES